MATQAQQTQLLTFLVGTFDAAPTAELFSLLEGALDNGATVSQLADVIVGSEYFTGVYADTDAFVANFPAALVGPFVSEEVLTAAEGIVSQWINDGASVATVISKALVALSGVDAADETWGAAAAALSNKVEVAQYFVDTVSGTGYATVAEMQAILAGVTQDAATVTTAKATADALADSINNEGSTFTLTTAADPVNGTSMNDVITAAAGTFNSGDLIADAYSTDNDTLNVTLDEDNIAATVSGIENINIDLDVFDGALATLDADNISDATITFSSDKLGFNGVAEVVNAGDNTIVAGTNVEDLSVTAAAGDTANVAVTGDVAVTVNTATTASLTASGDVDIDYTTGANQVTETTVNGTGDVELSMVVADIIAAHEVVNAKDSGTLTLNVTDAGAFNATDFDVDSINLEVSVGATATVASGATLTTSVAQDSLVIAAAAATAATNTVTLETDSNLTTSTTFTNIKTANIVVSDDVTAADIVTAETVNISGEGDVTVTTANAEVIDASGLTGALEVGATTAASAISGGTGANDVTTGNFDSSYTGQNAGDTLTSGSTTTTTAAVFGSGDDTLETALTTGTLVAQMGAGNDTVDFTTANVAAGADITLDGGAGTDTINFTLDDDFTAADTFDLINFEAMTLESGVDIVVSASDISGDTYTISGDADAGTETFTITGSATAVQTIDASNLTVTAIDTFTINGGSAADTITGTATDDVIVSNGGADVLTGGAGADTFTFVANDSTESAMASITDFDVAEFDVLDNGSTVLVDVVATDVSGVTSQVGDTVTASTTNGIMTLAGADAANINTLAEWIDAAEIILAVNTVKIDTLAFEFDGNTYVVDATAGGVTQNVIELTGVTGIDAVAATAGVDTLVIA